MDALLVAPAGAVMLAAVQAGALRVSCLDQMDPIDQTGSIGPGGAGSTTVEAAVRDVRGATFEELVEVGVFAAHRLAGPHTDIAPTAATRALRGAQARRRVAEAIVDRFAEQLESPMQRPSQAWWWMFEISEWSDVLPLGCHPGAHWAWLTAPANWFFTINAAPTSLRGVLDEAWDASSYDLTRWSVAVDPDARILEIHRPEDWAALAVAHPDDSRTGRYDGWEINARERGRDLGLGELAALPGQLAVRSGVRRFVEPDWASVADEWDAVHLSWAGFLTAEGTVCDLGDGGVAMLRGWGSERTLWLNPVLSDPQPIDPDAAAEPGRLWRDPDDRIVDLRTDHVRFERERAFLFHRLGLLP